MKPPKPKGYWKARLAGMKVGDSFVIDDRSHDTVAAMASHYRPDGTKFKTTQIGYNRATAQPICSVTREA